MKILKSAVLVLSLWGLSGTASAQTGSFEEELAQLREDVTFLQRQVYNDNNSSASHLTSSKNVSVQMGQFDELLRQVIGRTDELEHRIKKLNERLDMMNKDVDVRFKLLEGKPISGGGMSDLSEKAKFAAPVASDAPKSIVGDSIKGDDLKPLKGFDVKGIYQEGLEALKGGNDKLAEEKFNTILSRFQSDALAGNAQYWLGEVYYGRKDFTKAAVAFAKGYEKYKSGPKGADSLLKLGMSMRELKKIPEACAAFTSLAKEFPKAEKSLLDRAKTEAVKLKCK